MARKYHQGKFKPKNPQKYQGDSTNVIYRSSWERLVFVWLDNHPACIGWNSEEVVIPYISPVDQKPHRYFLDVKATFKYQDGSKKTFLIEIKPYSQTLPPKNTTNKKRLLEESMTYAVNQAKWEAATKYAKKYGYEFKVITEKEIGIK